MHCGRESRDPRLHNMLRPRPTSLASGLALARNPLNGATRSSRGHGMPPYTTHNSRGGIMSVAKVIEITAESEKGFDDAVRRGIEKAGETLDNIRAAWIANQEVLVEDNQVRGYRVHLRVTFVLG